MQILELAGTLLLLKNTIKPQYKLAHFFRHNISEERNLVLASALGLSFLILLVFLSSLLIDTFIEAKVRLTKFSHPLLAFCLLYTIWSSVVCITLCLEKYINLVNFICKYIFSPTKKV